MSKRLDCRYVPTDSASKLSMEAAVHSVSDKIVNGIMFIQVWLVLHIATGPEVVGPVHLRCSSNLELLLQDFETQKLWICLCHSHMQYLSNKQLVTALKSIKRGRLFRRLQNTVCLAEQYNPLKPHPSGTTIRT